jgi:hypothetical protein
MKIVGALFGFLILAAVFVVWFRAYKSIKGDESLLNSVGKRNPRQQNSSLEEFLAAYKRGEVNVGNVAPAAAKTAALPPASALPAAAVPSAAAGHTIPVKHESFLSGAAKLAYLACKTGLRGHHVFAHVQLSSLAAGKIDAALSDRAVDLLVCNAALSAVAAIDIIDASGGLADVAKSDYLRALGIRYLRLSAKSLPRPGDWHALLYKM